MDILPNDKENINACTEFSTEFYFEFDPSNSVLKVSDVWKIRVGLMYFSSMNLYDGLLDLMSSAKREIFLDKFNQFILSDITEFRESIAITNTENETKWFQIKAKKRVSELGNDTIIGVFTDITEHYREKQVLEKQLFSNNLLLRAVDSFVFCVDTQFNLTAANDLFFKVFTLLIKNTAFTVGDNFIEALSFNTKIRSKWIDLFTRAFRGETYTTDHHFNYPDIQVDHWYECLFRPVYSDEKLIGASVYLKDISQRKKMEEDLLKSSKKFNSLFQRHAAIMILIDPFTGNIIDGNDSALQFYGYNYNEFLKLNISQLSHTPSIEETTALQKSTVGIQKLLYYHQRSNGEIRTVDIHSSYIEEDNRSLLFFIIFDVTEQIAIENKLIENQQVIETAQEVANFGFVSADMETNVFQSSPVFDKIVGIDDRFTKTLDHYSAEIILPEFYEAAIHEFNTSLQNKQPYSSLYKIKRLNDAEVRWVKVFGVFLYDSTGKPIQTIAAFQDVTNFQNLLEERDRIITSITDYFYVLDKNLNYVYCNEVLRKLLDMKTEDLIGKNIFNVNPLLLSTPFQEKLQYAMEHGESIHFEFYISELNSWYDQYFYPFDGGCTCIYKDITYRKTTEANLFEAYEKLKIRTEELVNTNTELERFAFVASHDLQEPLRLITNFINLFENKYSSVVDDKGKKYITIIVENARRMRLLINDLLQYSRLGANTLETEDVDMNEVMDEVLLLFKNELIQAGITLNLSTLPIIRAGKSALVQLMQNLIGNAIKYRREVKPEITVGYTANEQDWIFSVKDNGIGIDPQYAEKIFIIFQRLHHSNEYGGSGIGLAICKKITEHFKGKIWVVSTLGEGSEFFFTIPRPKV